MGKSTHFFGQPVYGQLIESLDRDKILNHLGIEKVPKRSTLSDANARRSERFFEGHADCKPANLAAAELTGKEMELLWSGNDGQNRAHVLPQPADLLQPARC